MQYIFLWFSVSKMMELNLDMKEVLYLGILLILEKLEEWLMKEFKGRNIIGLDIAE